MIAEVTTTKAALEAARSFPSRRVVTARPARRVWGGGCEIVVRRWAVSWRRDQRWDR